VSLCKLVKSGEDEEKEKGTEDDNENEDGEDDEKSEDGEDEKEDEDEDEGKRKKKMVKLAAAHGMALSKILSLEARLHKAQTELEGLKKKAAAPKAAVRAISKGEDTGGPDLEAALQKQAMALSALSETERATALVRIIRSTR
jgi:TATA-binding protein-associated factor Taf7